MRKAIVLTLATALLLMPTTAIGQDTGAEPEASALPSDAPATSSDVAYACISYDPTVNDDASLAVLAGEFEVVSNEQCRVDSGASPKPMGGTLTGSIILVDAGVSRSGSTCRGTEGYSDIGPNMNVTVRNEKGEVIGTGNTQDGPVPADYPSVTCILTFTVSDLPAAQFYAVSLGRRGELTYSREELDGLGWNLALTLGVN